MVKENKNGSEEIEKDVYDILTDNGNSQLEDQLLKSKRKMLNAKRGKNEIFEVLKLKLKGLDMMILILQNNKNLLKNEDVYCLETLGNLLNLARNDKVMFEPIVKKIKTIVNLILKNQILLEKEEKFEELIKFIVQLMNVSFENSFLQQVIDKVKTNEKIFSLFIMSLFTKFFTGRNVTIKINDLRYLIKYTVSHFGPFYFFNHLVKFLLNKSEGGARTNHQTNQVFNLMTYILEISANKLKEENSGEFKQKLDQDSLVLFGKKIIKILKDNLKAHLDKDDKEEIAHDDPKKTHLHTDHHKHVFFFIGLIAFFERFVSFLMKMEFIQNEEVSEKLRNITLILEKVVEKYQLNNMQKKITFIKEKLFTA